MSRAGGVSCIRPTSGSSVPKLSRSVPSSANAVEKPRSAAKLVPMLAATTPRPTSAKKARRSRWNMLGTPARRGNTARVLATLAANSGSEFVVWITQRRYMRQSRAGPGTAGFECDSRRTMGLSSATYVTFSIEVTSLIGDRPMVHGGPPLDTLSGEFYLRFDPTLSFNGCSRLCVQGGEVICTAIRVDRDPAAAAA